MAEKADKKPDAAAAPAAAAAGAPGAAAPAAPAAAGGKKGAAGADGSVTGAFSNGETSLLAQIAVATFDNPNGLVDNGGNQFTEGPNSGVAVISTPQTLGAGSIRSGALELSNVDLSEEFINMIISSTGFSAASRVITTSDQLLTELLNSAR